jgi:[calcium/calmodulin-dependent protein kinase] kinase
LVTEEDVLKIVDFGVSEMFDKEGEMKTAKSAGSPAFMPPELCVAKHGHVSGRAADIWSMGCTLYCLLFGRIPFERTGMIELYQSIRNDPLEFDADCNDELKDLLLRLLEKDPQKRITMEEIRVTVSPPIFKPTRLTIIGSPMGHATRNRSSTRKVGERCYHT